MESCYALFCPIISPLTKFHPNRTKNTEVRNFHFWSILVGQADRSKNVRRHIKFILCRFGPIINVQKLIKQKVLKIVLVMKSGVKIVLKTIKNYKISLKIVFLDIFDVLMWLICEIL